MAPYFLFIMPFALLAMLDVPRRLSPPLWFLTFIALIVFVGFRHEVGMDWFNYQRILQDVEAKPLLEAMFRTEPGYAALLWLSAELGGRMYLTNVVGTAVLAAGLIRFCKSTPEPWLALMASLPILVIVVGMSANRQAIAIGILLWAAADWERRSLIKRLAFVGTACLFHFSAVIFTFFCFFDLQLSRTAKIVLGFAGLPLIAYVISRSDQIEYYSSAYASGSEITQSSGAVVHILLNGIPSLLVVFRKRLGSVLFPTLFLKFNAFATLGLLALLPFASSAAGRLSLYFFPVSLYVISSLPSLFTRSSRNLVRVILISVLILQVAGWLQYGNSAVRHIPYQNFFTTPSPLLAL